jgi:hypothetical protein
VTHETGDDAGVEPAEHMQKLLFGYRATQLLSVAAVLGLSDHLDNGPRSSADLATAVACDPDALHRLLRGLASLDVYEELPDGRFASTSLGALLRSDGASMRGWAALLGSSAHWQAWGALLHSVRTGENAFTSVHGQSVWDFRADRPEEGALFDAAMTSVSRQVAASILNAYDFGRFSTVVDVAGGQGSVLAAILARHPGTRGILFDQPHVVTAAPQLLADAGVQDRCEIVGGDMFQEIPAGGDAYVMKAILHDWQDPEAIAILRACRRAMGASATLVVIERVLDGTLEAALSDLNMLVAAGGRERTLSQFETVLLEADLRMTRTVPSASGWAVIEAVPVS